MADEAIAYVVRSITGEEQISVRFSERVFAHQFADNCAMPVRIWRIVRKPRAPRMVERSALTGGPPPISS